MVLINRVFNSIPNFYSGVVNNNKLKVFMYMLQNTFNTFFNILRVIFYKHCDRYKFILYSVSDNIY